MINQLLRQSQILTTCDKTTYDSDCYSSCTNNVYPKWHTDM